MEKSKSRNQIEDWLKNLHIDCENVGDIGVSDNPNKNRVGSFVCKHYICFDVIHHKYMDEILDLNKPYTEEYQDYFDVIFCTEVYDHIVNPVQATENIYRMLKEGGSLFLTVAFLYPHHGKEDYLRLTKYGLAKIFDNAGFRDVFIQPRVATTGKEKLQEFYDVECMSGNEEDRDIIGFIVEAIK